MFESISIYEGIGLFALGYFFAFLPAYLVLSRAKSTWVTAICFVPLFALVMVLPLLIPNTEGAIFNKLLRFFLFLPLYNFVLRNIDLAVQRKNSPDEPFTFKYYLNFISTGFGTQDAPTGKPKPDFKGGFTYLGGALWDIGCGCFFIFLNTYLRTEEWNYPFSIISKVGYMYWFASGMANLNFSYCRFTGKDVSAIYHAPIRALSPEDFWSNRLNLYIRGYLLRFVYLPIGGPKRPGIGILATFMVSGMIHEYQFDCASMDPAGFGWVFLYFNMHGLAVMTEQKLKRYFRRNHKAFYQKASQSPAMPFVFVPIHCLWQLFTGAIGYMSFDKIVNLHQIGFVQNFLASLPLPPFPPI